MSPIQIEKALPWRVRMWWADRKRREALESLAKIPHPRARDVSRAIQKTIAKSYSSEESKLIEEIERLRQACLKSDREIESIDYGAGEPSKPRTLEESRRGVARKFALSHLARHTSKAAPWSHLLFNVVRELRPRRCLELGTCIGFSAAYQCSAMMLNGTGSLATLEGDSNFAALARAHLHGLGVHNFDIIEGRFEDTLDTTLEKNAPLDFMFNDGHHDGQAMLAYYEKCLPAFAEHAVLMFDDIATYDSMRAGWQSLCKHERVQFVVDFGPIGLVGLRGRGGSPAPVFSVDL